VGRLEVSDIAKTLGGETRRNALAVLCGATFDIAPGECLGLKGSTGAGKSTLLRIIAGLLPPDAGAVRLDGQLLSSPTLLVPPAKRGIGFVFQTLGLWPHLTVLGHLDFVLAAMQLSSAERSERRAEMIQTFLLEGLERRYPAELSGGEKHLLALARALCPQVRLLLLDEPFNGLDGALKERILGMLRRERLRRNLTTLLVTHNDDEMRLFCQRVEHLQEGCILERSQHSQAFD
jgi:ABC-type sulfate/molybdate transport systems ATPase subunit